MNLVTSAVRVCSVLPGLLASLSAVADNPQFQAFFFQVCNNPQGTLATRCAETTDAAGDLSGNSESSLNPNQTVNSNQTPLANARSQVSRAEERIDELQDGKAPSGNTVMIGPFSLLANGNYTWFEQNATDLERGYDGDASGIELGLDYRLSDKAVIGGFLGYENTDFDYDKDEAGRNFTPQDNSGTNDADTASLILFGSYYFDGGLYTDGSVGISTTDYELERNVVFQESTRTVQQTNVRAKGDPDGDAYWLSGNVGYKFDRDAWSYTPYLRATYVRSEIDSYTEKDLNGSGLNMRVDDNNRDSFTTSLGLQGSYAFRTGWGVLLPQAYLEYIHEFDEDAQTSTTSFVLDAGNTRYTIQGDDPDRDYYSAGVGFVSIFPYSWIMFLNYDATLGYDDLDRQQVVLGIRKEF